MLAAGIDALGFHAPHYFLNLSDLAAARNIDPNKFQAGLGQEKMAVIPPDEDIVSMAANAASRALLQVDKEEIDWLFFATESGIDQSKAAGIFVHRLLNLPSSCRVVELKQACYSATAAIQIALPMVKCGQARKVLVIASDIARYGLNTSGESSQGGGAVAMILSQNPRILAIEPESGTHTEDAMDFWRPNYREEALVDGKYSCELYLRSLQKTWESYAALSGRAFSDHAKFCYHVPIPRLVEKAHQFLVRINGFPKLSDDQLDQAVGPALKYGRIVGNCYTASLYLSLLSLLENSPADLSGQRIGFYSYGSGCVAEFFSGVVQENYRAMLDISHTAAMLSSRQSLTAPEYEAFFHFPYPVDGSALRLSRYQKGPFRLSAIQDHKRVYETADTY